jgi:hypothetical protein
MVRLTPSAVPAVAGRLSAPPRFAAPSSRRAEPDAARRPASEAIFQIMDSVGEADDERSVDAHVKLERSNRRYLEAFKSNARIYTLFDQVAATDPVVRDLHLRSRRFHIARVASTIERWQARGLADRSIDATTTAAALVSMTSHFAHWLYVGGDDQYDEETAIGTLTDIWIRATGLRAFADDPA